MEADDPGIESIRRYARGALRQADVVGVVPVPVELVAETLRFAPPVDLFDLGELPTGLRARLATLKDRVLGALDIREHVIYLDRGQRPERQRFHHGHELGHAVLPWHQDAYYGDDRFTLDPDTEERLDAEASRFSVELLTGVGEFPQQAAQYRLGLGAPLELAERWQLSRAATIRHYVESHPGVCGLLKVGRFPGLRRVRVLDAFESATFRARYGPMGSSVSDWLAADDCELGAAAYELIGRPGSDAIIEGTHRLPDGRSLEFELTHTGYFLYAVLFEHARIRLGRRIRPIWTRSDVAQGG